MARSSDYIVRLRANNADLKKKLSESRRRMNAYDRNVKAISRSVKSSMSGFFAVGAAALFIKSQFEMVKQIDNLDRSLKSVTGSQAEFNKTQEFLVKTADDYGIMLNGLTKQYISYAAAVKDTKLEGEAGNEVFRKIAKAGGVLSLSNEQLTGTFRAVEQMLSKGTVQAEEIRGQLSERLPGAYKILAKSMGLSTEELGKQLKAGEVYSEKVLPKFADQLLKTYGADKVDRIESVTASQNRLSNEWVRFVRSIDSGEGVISRVFKTIADSAANALKSLREMSEEGTNKYFKELRDGETTVDDLKAKISALDATITASGRARQKQKEAIRGEKNELKEAIAEYEHWIDVNNKAKDLIETGVEIEDLTEKLELFNKTLESSRGRGSAGRRKEIIEDIEVYGRAIDFLVENLKKKVKPGTEDAIKNIEMFTVAAKDASNAIKDFSPSNDDLGLNYDYVKMDWTPMFNLVGLDEQSNAVLARIKKHQEDLAAESLIIQEQNKMIAYATERLIEDSITGVVDALAQGKSIKKTYGVLLGIIGEGLSDMGKGLIAQGIALQAFQLAFDPVTKIAAGIAAVAAGAAISSTARRTASKASGGSGGASSSRADRSSVALLGQTSINIPDKVLLVAKGEDLVGALEVSQSRQQRTG